MFRGWAIVALMFVSGQLFASETWLQVAGGVSQLGLDSVAQSNTTYWSYSLDRNSMGSGACVRLGYGINFERPFWFGAEYELLYTSTSGTRDTSELDASLPVHLLKISPGYYLLNRDNSKLGLGISAGLGVLAGSGTVHREAYKDLDGSLTGAAFLLEGRVSYEHQATEKLTLVGSFGYRDLTMENVEVSGVPLTRDDNHQEVPMDFGGVFFQVGFKWHLGSRSTQEMPDIGL